MPTRLFGGPGFHRGKFASSWFYSRPTRRGGKQIRRHASRVSGLAATRESHANPATIRVAAYRQSRLTLGSTAMLLVPPHSCSYIGQRRTQSAKGPSRDHRYVRGLEPLLQPAPGGPETLQPHFRSGSVHQRHRAQHGRGDGTTPEADLFHARNGIPQHLLNPLLELGMGERRPIQKTHAT